MSAVEYSLAESGAMASDEYVGLLKRSDGLSPLSRGVGLTTERGAVTLFGFRKYIETAIKSTAAATTTAMTIPISVLDKALVSS